MHPAWAKYAAGDIPASELAATYISALRPQLKTIFSEGLVTARGGAFDADAVPQVRPEPVAALAGCCYARPHCDEGHTRCLVQGAHQQALKSMAFRCTPNAGCTVHWMEVWNPDM